MITHDTPLLQNGSEFPLVRARTRSGAVVPNGDSLRWRWCGGRGLRPAAAASCSAASLVGWTTDGVRSAGGHTRACATVGVGGGGPTRGNRSRGFGSCRVVAGPEEQCLDPVLGAAGLPLDGAALVSVTEGDVETTVVDVAAEQLDARVDRRGCTGEHDGGVVEVCGLAR